ncbi:hypothetical protein DERP_009283 [Dermatophagoides pteronyssinus]|uniref:Secreted protein n=1 Tax=Dermatophagoides pteronyssinus TaxID=6956 RepID=A0ABQ8ITL4_DERPT|nr:hypothetical protein DERP_009283 [Dermatophagoides pteronyssinus]
MLVHIFFVLFLRIKQEVAMSSFFMITNKTISFRMFTNSNFLFCKLPFGCPLSCVNGSGLFCLSSSLLSFCSRN